MEDVTQVRDGSADELLTGAIQGDWAARDEIINRYGRLVVHTAAITSLSHSDAADVAQLTWLQLYKHGHQIREPERLAAWLVSTARREAIRLVAASKRYVLCADPSDEHSWTSRTAVRDVYAVRRGTAGPSSKPWTGFPRDTGRCCVCCPPTSG